MFKKFFTLLFVLALLSISCSKNDEFECLKGTVRFTNISQNPYKIYIDDVYYLTLSGNTFHEIDLSEGRHSATVIQVSGYLLFPTQVSSELAVFGCQDSEFVFP
jgi:uncharacterized membrane protein (GlpM family)